MKGINFLDVNQWKPFDWLDNVFFSFNSETITHTWIILLLLFIIGLPIRYFLKDKSSIGYFLITTSVGSFMELCEQTLQQSFSYNHFCFITTIFTFILLCNSISIIPGMDEPTKDLNTTLALGIISFLYIQIYTVKAHGFKEYLKEYLTPFFLMLPLHIIGKLATIVSISFRLFGNIFGGSIISHIYLHAIQGSLLLETLGLTLGINLAILIFFGLFEGFLQAFVFAMLSLTYLSIALQGEVHEDSKIGN